MATYYVAASGGNDGNAGTDINNPWATWDHAFNTPVAGDTVYFRGGTWYPTAGISINEKDGSAGNYINYFAYQDEIPIADFTNKTSGGEAIFFTDCNYIYIKGLTVCNNKDTNTELLNRSGWTVQFGGHIIFERCNSYGHHCRGFYMCSYTSITLTNCDSYDNVDPVDGNHGEGFVCIRDNTWDPHPTYTADITGCRAWGNSDSGFGSNYGDVETYTNCWAFDNGRGSAEGCGWKYLPSSWLGAGVKGRIFRNCIAAYNGHSTSASEPCNGFEENGTDGTLCDYTIDNCFSYYNKHAGFGSIGGTDNGTTRLIRNCISYLNEHDTINYNGNEPTFSNNSWQNPPNVTVGAGDFVSLTWSQLQGSRNSDGSLPTITFGHLTEGSDLIGAGIDVGLILDGEGKAFNNPPSLGPFEYATENLIWIGKSKLNRYH